MIRVVEADLTVGQRRRLRGASSLQHPVLAVAPDSRRVCDLRQQVLDAMGIAVDELRSRLGRDEHAAWFRAWCSAPDVRTLTVLAPHTADPSELGLLLIDVEQRVGGVTIVTSSGLPDQHQLLLHRLADEWTRDSARLHPTTDEARACKDARAVPSVPRVHTLSLATVSEAVHAPEDHAVLVSRFHQFVTAFDSALDRGPAAVLTALHDAAGKATSQDDLLLVLHGMAAAGWRRGGVVRLDPDLVARRAGAALRQLSPTTVGRLSRQAYPARAVVLVLGALGWSPDDALGLTVDDLGSLSREVPEAGVAMRALHRLRVAQGATGRDRAIPPTIGRHRIQHYTVRRWIGLLGPEYGVHTPHARSRQDHTTATQRLHRLGIRIRDV